MAFQRGGEPLFHQWMTLSDHGHAICPTRPISWKTCLLSAAKHQSSKSERQRGHVVCVLATRGEVDLEGSAETLQMQNAPTRATLLARLPHGGSSPTTVAALPPIQRDASGRNQDVPEECPKSSSTTDPWGHTTLATPWP